MRVERKLSLRLQPARSLPDPAGFHGRLRGRAGPGGCRAPSGAECRGHRLAVGEGRRGRRLRQAGGYEGGKKINGRRRRLICDTTAYC